MWSLFFCLLFLPAYVKPGADRFHLLSCRSLSTYFHVNKVLGSWYLVHSWPQTYLKNSSVLIRRTDRTDAAVWCWELSRLNIYNDSGLTVTIRTPRERDRVLILGDEHLGFYRGILVTESHNFVSNVTVQMREFGSYLLLKECGYEKIFLLDRRPTEHDEDYSAPETLLEYLQET